MNVSEYKKLIGQKPKKAPKYKNRKTVFMGLKFDSEAEASRYGELVILERMGQICGLERQVAYELAPAVKFDGETRKKPALRYVADFAYWEGDRRIIEDVKGVITEAFRIKRHLMKIVLGLKVRIVK